MSDTSSNQKFQPIMPALLAVVRDLPAIGKDSTNKAQGFKFRGIEDIMPVVRVVLARHGVLVTPEVTDIQRGLSPKETQNTTVLTVRYTFHAQDGSSIQAVVAGEGADPGDKATSKAMTMAFKYALIQVLSIASGYDDADYDSPHLAEAGVEKPKATKTRAAKRTDGWKSDKERDDAHAYVVDLLRKADAATKKTHKEWDGPKGHQQKLAKADFQKWEEFVKRLIVAEDDPLDVVVGG